MSEVESAPGGKPAPASCLPVLEVAALPGFTSYFSLALLDGTFEIRFASPLLLPLRFSFLVFLLPWKSLTSIPFPKFVGSHHITNRLLLKIARRDRSMVFNISTFTIEDQADSRSLIRSVSELVYRDVLAVVVIVLGSILDATRC